MQRIWIISDTHFCHKNIIDYCDRPFKDVEEMNEALISNWNSVVKEKHLVYVLGDFALGTPTEISNILSRLNGKKYLILGNHDRHKSVDWWRRVGFDEVSKFPIIVDDRYILCHEPMDIVVEFKVISGHIHNVGKGYGYNNHFNACVEVNNYTPVDFNKIKKLL